MIRINRSLLQPSLSGFGALDDRCSRRLADQIIRFLFPRRGLQASPDQSRGVRNRDLAIPRVLLAAAAADSRVCTFRRTWLPSAQPHFPEPVAVKSSVFPASSTAWARAPLLFRGIADALELHAPHRDSPLHPCRIPQGFSAMSIHAELFLERRTSIRKRAREPARSASCIARETASGFLASTSSVELAAFGNRDYAERKDAKRPSAGYRFGE